MLPPDCRRAPRARPEPLFLWPRFGSEDDIESRLFAPLTLFPVRNGDMDGLPPLVTALLLPQLRVLLWPYPEEVM
jgi:hypothetical protein